MRVHTGAQLKGLAAGETSSAGQWVMMGPNAGDKELWKPWLSECTSVSARFCPRYTNNSGGQWEKSGQQYAGAELEGLAYLPMVVVVSCGGSRLVNHSGLHWQPVKILASGGVVRWGPGEGIRWWHLNMNTYGAKTGEVCRDSVAAVMVVGFFTGKSCWVLSREVHWHCSVLLFGWYWLLLKPLLFLAISINLSFAALWVWWNLSRSFLQCPEIWRSW